MFFPKLKTLRQTRVTLNGFLGLDRREKAPQGSFYDMENMGSDAAPALQVRPRRGTVAQLQKGNGLACKDALVWVDGHTLYVGGAATGLVLSDSPKQLVSMGAYLVIFPDKKWINTRQLSQFGSLENRTVTTGAVSFSMCSPSGESIGSYLTAQQPPEAAQAGALWMDTSADKAVLRRYGEEGWTAVEDTCVKIAAAGIGVGFAAGDGVTLSGCGAAGLDGDAVLVAVERDALVVAGIVENDMTQDTAVTVARSVPDMDYVVECGNRLWGCKYGIVNGKAVNEIYGSKLGDFKNWNCFQGLSTDSYAASRGSDGQFTAAASYLGSVLFFKEQCIERLYINAGGAHQIVTLECPGVEKGSHKSVQTVEGTLYYHGCGGVYAFDGSLPVTVSQPLRDMALHGAVAGVLGGKYYLSALGGDGAPLFVVYDSRHKQWHREDCLRAADFAADSDELYCLGADGRILALRGSEGEVEPSLPWLVESNEVGVDTVQQKYPVRLSIRLQLAADCRAEAQLSYDGGKSWQTQGTLTGDGSLRGVLVHLRPRRCDHFRWRLLGEGECTVGAVSLVYEKGSDEV